MQFQTAKKKFAIPCEMQSHNFIAGKYCKIFEVAIEKIGRKRIEEDALMFKRTGCHEQ